MLYDAVNAAIMIIIALPGRMVITWQIITVQLKLLLIRSEINDNIKNQAKEGVNGWDTGSQYLLLPTSGESKSLCD